MNSEDLPIEGYIHDERDGRPVEGRRYRNPSGDSRILKGIVGLFLLICTAVIAFGLYSRPNSLTEYAFTHELHACTESFGDIMRTDEQIRLIVDTEQVVNKEPEVLDAAGLRLVIEILDEDRQLLATHQTAFDTRDYGWDTAGLILDTAVDQPDGLAMCDVTLSRIGTAAELGATEPVKPCDCVGSYNR